MSAVSERTRYIPFRKRDIITMIMSENSFNDTNEKDFFDQLCILMESIFHYEFHSELEKLKNVYFPINPDLKNHNKPEEGEIAKANEELLSTLQKVLNDANYDKITKEEIESAYENSALVGISVDIDMSDYDFIEIYTRGKRKDKFTIKRFFGLKKTEVEHNILERVLLIAKLKEDKNNTLIPSGTTIIKLFKDVPFEDLELLFPNSKVIMSLKDKLMIAVPAIAAGVPLLVTKVVPAFIVAFIIISAYFG